MTPRHPLGIGRSSKIPLPIWCVSCWPAAMTRRITNICKITYGDSAGRYDSALTPLREKRARVRTASLGSRFHERPRRERPKKGIRSRCCTGFGDVARVGSCVDGADSSGTRGLPIGGCRHGGGLDTALARGAVLATEVGSTAMIAPPLRRFGASHSSSLRGHRGRLCAATR